MPVAQYQNTGIPSPGEIHMNSKPKREKDFGQSFDPCLISFQLNLYCFCLSIIQCLLIEKDYQKECQRVKPGLLIIS